MTARRSALSEDVATRQWPVKSSTSYSHLEDTMPSATMNTEKKQRRKTKSDPLSTHESLLLFFCSHRRHARFRPRHLDLNYSCMAGCRHSEGMQTFNVVERERSRRDPGRHRLRQRMTG